MLYKCTIVVLILVKWFDGSFGNLSSLNEMGFEGSNPRRGHVDHCCLFTMCLYLISHSEKPFFMCEKCV